MNELTEKIKQWGENKGIIANSHPRDQYLKVVEEVGEIASGLARGDHKEVVDAIGDTYVTIVLLAEQIGVGIEECVRQAYGEIAERKGKIVNGVFVKHSDLNEIKEEKNHGKN